MLRSISILLGIAVLLAAGPAAPAQGEITTVDFRLQVNLIIVEIKVNGVPQDFILDTGASRTTIWSSLVEELGIEIAEKIKARGVGGEVDASVVRIESLSLGDITLHDFSCGVMDMKGVSCMMSGVSGVLGFDFLSQFKVTVDYRNKKLTLERYPQEDVEAFAINGNQFLSRKYGIEITKPDVSWKFVTATPLPEIPVIIEKENSGGSVRVQVQELHGITLDDILPLMESSLPVGVEDYTLISSGREKNTAGEYHVYEYTGKKDGEDKQFKHAVFKKDAFLYSIYFSADPAEYGGLVDAFDVMIQSIKFL